MKTIYFKNNDQPLVVEFIVKSGVLAVAYNIVLFEKDSNASVVEYKGNNRNPQPDKYQLPLPANINNGRVLMLNASFYALDIDKSKDYIFSFSFFQGGIFLGDVELTGTLTGGTQSELMFGKLIIQ